MSYILVSPQSDMLTRPPPAQHGNDRSKMCTIILVADCIFLITSWTGPSMSPLLSQLHHFQNILRIQVLIHFLKLSEILNNVWVIGMKTK